jgi:integrase
MRCPYTLYKEKTQKGLVWYSRFWDEVAKKYTVARSLGILVEGKRERRREAEDTARAMASQILEELRLIHAQEADKASLPFIDYVSGFWQPNSPYIRECATVKKKPLSKNYIKGHRDDTRLHIVPFPGFQGITLRQLTPGLIRDWMTWAAEKGLSGSRINKVMEAMRGAVKYAALREDIERDPFKNIGKAPESRKEKGVLTPAEIRQLIKAPITDPKARLAVLLGAICGLRLGEVRGLLWGDIGDGVITIIHNFVDEDGLKEPKLGSTGTVPIPASVRIMIDMVRKTASNPSPYNFVMESLECPGKPLGKTYFRDCLARELAAIGIPGEWDGKEKAPEGYVDEQHRRNLTFHGLRHTFVTLGRLAGISDFEIQALARHKSGTMRERYSHAAQVLNFAAAREKLEKAIGGEA